jgi:putative hemolysin
MSYLLGLTLVFLMVLSALFSATEAAFLAINKIRLRHMRDKKARGAEHVHRLTGKMEEVITTILVCNNLVNTAIAAIGAVVFVKWFGPQLGIFFSTVVVTVVLLIFCETTPKIFATRHPELVTFSIRHIVSFLIVVFRPFVWTSNKISSWVIGLGGKNHKRIPIVTEEEIKLMIRLGKEEGYYTDHEIKMLDRIFHFDEIDVFEVMTPFDKMVMIDIHFDEDALANTLMEKGHNRIPVYDKDPQNIVGILHVHDLLYLFKNQQLIHVQDLLSAPYFVPPDKKVSLLLKEFQAKKIQIAIVRSKNGKVMGLVTLEDLIEEIVGEIEEVTPV